MKQWFVAIAMSLLTPIAAHAQFAKTEDAIKYRQSVFTIQGNHMGRLAAMVKGNVPFDADKAQASAKIIQTMSTLPWEAFVPNSMSDKMKADPVKEAAEFKKHQEKFEAEANKLVTASATLEGLKAQFGPTGGSCKGCHDDFKK